MNSRTIKPNVRREPMMVEGSVLDVMRHREKLKTSPAADTQLARIWQLWNALHERLTPYEKISILNGGMNQEHWDQLATLRRRFPKSEFPLSADTPETCLTAGQWQRYGQDEDFRVEHTEALKQAGRWSALVKFIQTTLEHHQDLVTRQWAFAEADSQASGRVAIFRVANELRLLRPGFLELKSPTLADIALLDDRYSAYSNSREQALNAVSALVFKVPGMRTGKRLPLDEVALGVPNPPDDVPRYLYIARLDALGICSQERLNEYLRDALPKLSREKRQKFYEMSLTPRHGKEPYAALLVWLLENRPIFEHEQFGWQWGEIQSAADKKGIDCPRTSLKQWATNHRLGLHLKRGPATLDASRIRRSEPLLSPAPVFGDILKSGSK